MAFSHTIRLQAEESISSDSLICVHVPTEYLSAGSMSWVSINPFISSDPVILASQNALLSARDMVEGAYIVFAAVLDEET
jgi:hypothetical protein